ncbi:MAG: pirin family protein [Arenimonas sp.]
MNKLYLNKQYRGIQQKIRGIATSDGAGVRLTRVIGSPALPMLDPFLLLDEFGSEKSGDYIGGFPSHPHRGFETVTYMLDGRMRHKDNHGNEGLLTPGSVQWMSAGRGIVHSEMPEQEHGLMRGFQLWVNLPAAEKMGEPKYQEFNAEQIPLVTTANGAKIKVIAGQVGDVVGPVIQPATQPLYFDVQLADGQGFEHELPEQHSAFVYVYEGGLNLVQDGEKHPVNTSELISLTKGNFVQFEASQDARFIFVAGKPLSEPVARYGPFVMNTQAEIMQAVNDFQAGKF